jgi:phosphoglycolate phosphatase
MGESKRAVILDLDGTLYSWIDFYGPSFRAMVHSLNKLLDIDEEDLIESFKKVYQKHGSVEYSFSVQELDIWEDLDWSDEEIRDIAIKAARGAFRRARKRYLKLFTGVKETLDWFTYEDIIIFASTDAPYFHAEKRLKSLGIDKYFAGLICLKFNQIPNILPLDVQKKINQDSYQSRIPHIIEINKEYLKPDPTPLINLILEFNLDKNRTFYVGDSLEKDILLAQEVGVIDIWAKYGKESYQQKNLDTIIKITPWNKEDVKKSISISKEINPSFTINEFSELINIMGAEKYHQLPLVQK